MRRKLLLSLVTIMVVSFGSFFVVLATGTNPTLGLDLQGGVSVTQEPKVGSEFSDSSLDLAVEKIRERVDALGVAEPEIFRQGDAIVVNLPGVENQNEAIALVQVTGQVYLRPVMSQCQTLDITPTTTTVAGATTVPGTTVPGTTVPSTTAAPGPGRNITSSNTSTTVAETATTVSATQTTIGITPASATSTPVTTPAAASRRWQWMMTLSCAAICGRSARN